MPRFVLLCLLAAPLAAAQPVTLGAEAGLGLGAASRPGLGYSARAAAWGVRGPWALTVRQVAVGGGSSGFEGAFRGTVQRDVYLDQALLVGRVVARGAARAVVSAGPAVVYGDLVGTVPEGCTGAACRPGERRSTGPTLAVALEAVARRPLAAHLDGHAGLFGTIGAEQPYGGVAVGLTLTTRR